MIQVRLEQALYQVARTVVGLVGGEAEWQHLAATLGHGSPVLRRRVTLYLDSQ
jgi:hypothetical protein